MSFCKSFCIAVILLFLLPNPDKFKAACNKTSSVWTEARKITRLLLHNCSRLSTANSQEQFLIILQDCLKRKTLQAFDRVLERDVIELVGGVALVRYQRENGTRDRRYEVDWKSQVAKRLTQLFTTHVLKIHLNELHGLQFEGTRNKEKHNMFSQLLMFAMIAAGVIVIPLGFQFLAILGGKALLLAKMALLMTSIQGLKKIATSNLNYGLYSTYSQGPWHYDRKWPYPAEGHGDTYTTGYESNPHYDILHPRQDAVLDNN
ncbi:uncharacterized protein LOC108903470 [Anoplophora glabripennis]|uniref:uncharacterized protein LOC108903470 n=1 Tax=Anoplophora glabripennis TaxID=217634 RepID=UPI00087484A1|nr:uncharacterized protein LOC108903470 [Anoplophora glabripennis]